MLIKTGEAIGYQLDWLVAKCEGRNTDKVDLWKGLELPGYGYAIFPYSTDWSQGGPLIEREWISVYQVGKDVWKADIAGQFNSGACPTPLIAAMRCYVSAKIGDEVEIPEELCK